MSQTETLLTRVSGIELSEGSNLVICLILAFPLAICQRLLQNPNNTTPIHLLSITSTSLLLLLVFDLNAVLWLGGVALGSWLFGRYPTCMTHHLTSRYAPHLPGVSFMFVFLVLAYVQAKSQLFPSPDWADFASPMMYSL